MNENRTTNAALSGGPTPSQTPAERSHGESVTARLLISLEEMVSDSDDVDDGKQPAISSATLARARQAIGAARRAR